MSAELLREAAALMRERASAATQGPWAVQRGYATGVTDIWMPDDARGCYAVTAFGTKHRENGQHIVSWQPEVALAVAKWIEAVLDLHQPFTDPDGDVYCKRCVNVGASCLTWPCGDTWPAIAVARAYLGHTS